MNDAPWWMYPLIPVLVIVGLFIHAGLQRHSPMRPRGRHRPKLHRRHR